MEELMKEFLLESTENLNRVDNDLLILERNPQAPNVIDSIFRAIHTVKGTCGFLGFARLQSVSHVGENLLSKLRDGTLPVTPDIINALLALGDAIREILHHIERTEQEGVGNDQPLIDLLDRLTRGEPALSPQPKPTLATAAAYPETPLPETIPEAKVTAPPFEEGTGVSVAESSIRVDLGLLDKLMDLVGELVLARNQILQFSSLSDDAAYAASFQRLNHITTELQESVMKTRMQPIGSVWGKYPRLVRDLSLQCGKKINLEMEGKETELDRTLIEAIKDPLTHIVRNAIDHGIETPEKRLARGKPPTGNFKMRAYHEGGQVTIEIRDDGNGIDPERVKQKALEKGLITHEQAIRLTDQEACQLIFSPGFSTAEKITNISGRGVGMDVVKTNIEKVGGTIDLQSRHGHGTNLKIKIPLTLAIVPALIVSCGGDRYAIPQVSLLELVRLEGEQIHKSIEMIQNTPVYRLRGKLLPLVYLNRVLQVEETVSDLALEERVQTILVLQADEEHFGLVVEKINDTEEIVVKPLSLHLKSLNIFAGATILGDGKVALILDAFGIAQHIGVLSDDSDSRERLASETTKGAEEKIDPAQEQKSYLLFSLGADLTMALPLDEVARLEEIKRSSIERAGGRYVIQYRGSIMPLIYLPQVILGQDTLTENGEAKLPVVVYSQAGRMIGLVVDEIIDIVEESFEIQYRINENGERISDDGILGSAVIQGQVRDLLDVTSIIQKTRTVFFQNQLTTP